MNHKKIAVLSKSKYLAGIQCALRLWHRWFNLDLAAEMDYVNGKGNRRA